MVRTAIEIGVIASTLFLGGCVTTVDYGYPYDEVIRVHEIPHTHRYAYIPRPVPRRIYYYNRLWYDEPSTIVIRSRTDRVRVPNTKLKNHFNRMPKRDVRKDIRDMDRKRHEQQMKKRRSKINESTRIKRDSTSDRKVQGSNRRRGTLRTRKRPSTGNDKRKDSNRVRVHNGSNRKGRRSSSTYER